MKAFLQRYAMWLALLLLLLLGVSGYFAMALREKIQTQAQERELLAAQLREANEAQKAAVITRRVSSQLEEIAYQQKEISDAQKQEAEHQTQIAEQMRDHAELEREKAILAQQATLEAYEQVDAQKQLAEQRREEAVLAQMRADSLARLALARSLGVQASKQYEVGNKSLAGLLSYAAWKFSSENQGDPYLPDLYKALSQNSELSKQWRIHRGAIRSLLTYSSAGKNYLVTSSQYGEIYRWTMTADHLTDQMTLFSNSQYDFRILRSDTANQQLLALAYDGRLVTIDAEGAVKEHELSITQPVGMVCWRGKIVIAQKNGELRVVLPDNWTAQSFYRHTCAITVLTVTADKLLIGDAQGGVYQIDSQGKSALVWQQLQQPITALCEQESSGVLAIGYKQGLVSVLQPDRKTVEELSEQVSSITCMMFNDSHLYTGSLDGSICLWQLHPEKKATAALVFEEQAWLHTFTIHPQEHCLIIGDEQGNLSQVVVDPQRMANEIYQRLERNFTPEEWNMYIGEVSAYETFVSK